jgi:curved DNA-binding protein CbpA
MFLRRVPFLLSSFIASSAGRPQISFRLLNVASTRLIPALSSSVSPDRFRVHVPVRSISLTSICFASKKSTPTKKAVVPHKNTQVRFSEDYYELLEVSRTATTSEIKKAYFAKAKACHPDLNPGNQQAETLFKMISEAYSILSDPHKREKYDLYGREGLDSSDITFGETFRQLFGAGSFDDFFGDLTDELEDDEAPKETNEYAEKRKDLLKLISAMKKGKEWKELKKELDELERLTELENKRDREIHQREVEAYELREKKRDEMAQALSAKLIALISDYKFDSPENFRSSIRYRAQELMESPGGLGLVEVLGNAYSRLSRQYFDDGSLPLGLSKFVAWGSHLYEKASIMWSVVSSAKKLKKMESVRKDMDKKEKNAHEEQMVRTGAQTIWNFGKLLVWYFFHSSHSFIVDTLLPQITNRIVRVCKNTLADEKVDSAERQRRCRAISEMGSIFLSEAAERRKSRQNLGEGQWQEYTDGKKK